MSARLDSDALEAFGGMERTREAMRKAREDYGDARLTYIRAGLEAGWSWRRIGYEHKGFWERNRQRAGRLP